MSLKLCKIFGLFGCGFTAAENWSKLKKWKCKTKIVHLVDRGKSICEKVRTHMWGHYGNDRQLLAVTLRPWNRYRQRLEKSNQQFLSEADLVIKLRLQSCPEMNWHLLKLPTLSWNIRYIKKMTWQLLRKFRMFKIVWKYLVQCIYKLPCQLWYGSFIIVQKRTSQIFNFSTIQRLSC